MSINIFNGFSRREVGNNIELKVILGKLQFLTSTMENGTDKPSDIKHWQKLISELNNLDIRKNKLFPNVQVAYNSLYKIYLIRHYSDL